VQLEELKKALDHILELQKVTSNQLEIATLLEVINREHVEKLELKRQVRLLERDLECREASIKELRLIRSVRLIAIMNSGRPTIICLRRRSAALPTHDLKLWRASRGHE